MDVDDLTLPELEKCIGDSFAVENGTEVELELVEAQPLTSGPAGVATDRSFSLLFRGPVEPPFEQGVLELTHRALGTLSIFVVPVAENAESRYYEAVFNRLD